jgi:2-polyprenyl-3-methyl-5-hydroxy-6-metoxy-1,4-benzoquinol methylase
MQKIKYYDHQNDRPINIEKDGCYLAEWGGLKGKALFAKHPKGFNIFLSPDKITASDEYKDSDPYTVEQNIDSEFHTRRIELTIDLVREAVSKMQQLQVTPQILDLGCGQGHITEKIRQAISGSECTGLDYSISAIEYAHKHFPQIEFSVGDVYHCPYTKEFFDVVVCNNLWEHVPDPLFLLSKIKCLLKPGGYLIVSTPSRYSLSNLLRILRGKTVVFMSRHHVTEYTVGQVVEQLAVGGFDVRKTLSRAISAWSLKASVAGVVFSMLIKLIGSHHQLESTVFYLAQKRTSIAEQGSVLDHFRCDP